MFRYWLLVLFVAIPAFAANSLEQHFTCPICGQEWSERVETSAHPTGLRLDLRQVGDVVDPPTLPQCPQCRFVFFSENLTPATLDKLKPFIKRQDYQLFAAKSPTYFSLAQIQQFLKAPPRFVAQSYLRAAWQMEEKPLVSARYLSYAEEQLARALGGMLPTDKDYLNTALLRGEVLRRLERWDDAASQFRSVATRPDFQDPRRKYIVEQELNWIERKDHQPQLMREPTVPEPPMLPDPQIISIRKPKPPQ